MGHKMTVRDSHATLNADKTTYSPPSGCLEVINENGSVLFEVSLVDGMSLEVRAVGNVHAFNSNGYLTERIGVAPIVRNAVHVFRMPEAQRTEQEVDDNGR